MHTHAALCMGTWLVGMGRADLCTALQVRLRRLGVRRKEAALAQRYAALFEQWRSHLQGAAALLHIILTAPLPNDTYQAAPSKGCTHPHR